MSPSTIADLIRRIDRSSLDAETRSILHDIALCLAQLSAEEKMEPGVHG